MIFSSIIGSHYIISIKCEGGSISLEIYHKVEKFVLKCTYLYEFIFLYIVVSNISNI